MTLTLSPEDETRILALASWQGLPPTDALDALLKQALADAESQRHLLDSLRTSADDHDAGRSMTLDEYRAQAHARRHEQDGRA